MADAPDMDIALIIEGVVAQVWRGEDLETFAAKYGPHDGTIVEAKGAVCGQLYAGGDLEDPAIEPTFTLKPFTTVAAALGSTVASEVLTLGATHNLIAAFRDVDVGRFWFFFEAPVPSAYHVVGSGIRLIEGDEYGFQIETVDPAGSPYDPPVFDVQVQSK